MDEFEIFEDGPELFAGAEAEAENIAMSEAAEVEENAAVQEMVKAPAIESVEDTGAIRDFIKKSEIGQKLWSFAKWAFTTAGGAAVAFIIFYGLNKAIAKDAHESGKRTALSEYLKAVQASWEKQGLKWNEDIRQRAAEDALAFPWIDATA